MTLEIIRSDLLSHVKHGFFTRKGGASSGVFEGLNCGAGSSDQSEMVAINRARVTKAMALDPGSLITVHQTHSAAVFCPETPHDGPPPQADGLATKTPGLGLAILTADCQPVLFADRQSGVIGAAHAGWKGTLAGILEATIDAMCTLGAARETISAAIGPSISQRAYEVGPEFFDRFMEDDPENARFFANGEGDRMLFDLPGFGLTRLRASGIGDVEWTRHCTYSDPARFFSYRRSTHERAADYGRLISVIRL